MGIFDGLIGSVISGIGGVVSNSSTDERQEKAQVFNAEQAALNRDFQMQMSNTAYQRGMDDMKKAGLNPILAYQKGPASSPSGATASTSFTPASNVGEAMVSGYNNSARTASDNAKTDMGTKLVTQEVENAKAMFGQIQAQTAKALAETTKTEADTRISEAVLPKTVEEGKKLASENTARSVDSSFYGSKFGAGARYLGNFLSEVNPLKGLIGGFSR